MNFNKAFYFLVISMMFVTDGYADSYKANGEVFLINGQTKGEWSRRVWSSVVSEKAIFIEQGAHKVSLVFIIEPPPSVKYSLTVSLMTVPQTDGEISTILMTNTYQANLVGGSNGPFEFEEEQHGLKFGGAIAVNRR